jgi:hypothetical protein
MNTQTTLQDFETLTIRPSPKYRVGIQGAPGTGKTFAAATFPDPHFLELENTLDDAAAGIQHHLGIDVSTIKRIKFFNDDWVRQYCKTAGIGVVELAGVVNKRDAIKHWILNKGKTIPITSSLILDTWTTLQIFFDQMTVLQPSYTKKGEIDEFAFWDKKITYSEEVMTALESLECNVVVLLHEHQQRDPATGMLLDKIQPLMQGKFVTYIKKYFPNFFRAKARVRLDSSGKPVTKDGRDVVDYVWQTASDREFDAKCSVVGLSAYVPATYKSLVGEGSK